ncbi:amidohydrolase [Pseudoalteromonas phenolica]|uniref:Omega-amidase YafV n=1 Tax=Pseudoalteromonas phenolica TaxID=161398 RepID=A0A4Q7IKA7_9GAMM|nr:amidohydrolase [Pseudoalteromonas phenolica]RZQ52111.1 amidohydrolase [Pseudoalteromonas phenolica]
MSAINSESLKVALVQSDIVWLQPQQNLDNLTMQLQHIEPVDLILLPETFATGFAINLASAEAEQGPVFNWMQTQATAHNAVVTGSVLVEQQDKKANRFYWCRPDGSFEFYDKRHLFCLGKEGDYVRAGDSRKVFTINGFRLLPQICYDLRFPVFQRNRNDYDVMVNVANWPAARRRIWDTLLQARAIENQCYVLASNRVGDDGNGVAHNGGTAAYDFVGEALAQGEDNKPGIVISELSKEKLEQFRKSFPAHLDADDFSINF